MTNQPSRTLTAHQERYLVAAFRKLARNDQLRLLRQARQAAQKKRN